MARKKKAKRRAKRRHGPRDRYGRARKALSATCCPANSHPSTVSQKTGKKLKNPGCYTQTGKRLPRLKKCGEVVTSRIRSVGSLGCGCAG